MKVLINRKFTSKVVNSNVNLEDRNFLSVKVLIKTRVKDLKNKIGKYKTIPVGIKGVVMSNHHVSWPIFFMIMSVGILIPSLFRLVSSQLDLVCKHKINDKKRSSLTGLISSLVIALIALLLLLVKVRIYAIVYAIISAVIFIYSLYLLY